MMELENNYWPIDYHLLGKAILYYEEQGYTYLEVPWLVSDQAKKITFNTNSSFETPHGVLIGSAEQSFLDLELQGKLKPGKYVACTPCFREDEEDTWHKKYFMKVELYENQLLEPEQQLQDLLNVVQGFMRKYLSDLTLERTKGGVDLTYQGVELGSYGFQNYKDVGQSISWLYGTGIAEPRFSKTVALKK